jgi:hypothetical protein
MKTRIFVVLLLLLPALVDAQEVTLFKILSFSPGVVIDNIPATFGMDVRNPLARVYVPQGGYAIIITAEGNVRELRNTGNAADAGEQGSGRNKWQATGSVIICVFDEYDWPLAPPNNEAGVVGDSVFVYWVRNLPGHPMTREGIVRDRAAEGNYKLRVLNMFDEDLGSVSVQKNWSVVKLPENETAVLFEVVGNKSGVRSSQYLAKRLPPGNVKKRLNDDLAQIPDDENKFIHQCAIYEFHNLRHDMSMPIYHILTKKFDTDDSILIKYFDLLSKKYHLNLIDID